jgi:rod shape-determining protein MreC
VFKPKNKTLISIAGLCLLFLLTCLSIPFLRAPFLIGLRQPFNLFTLIQNEIKAVIFFQRNYIQNEKLIKEIELLNNKINLLKEIAIENTRLKEMLSFKQGSLHKLIVARVIARSADSWSSTLLIDKGRHSNIKEGMVVVNYSGLIGRVVETQYATSKIMLLADPNVCVSSIVQRSRQEGLVCGTLGPNLIMKYLANDADINIKDTIITSGLNETYPKGIVIGTVVDIVKEFSGLSLYAIIKPAVNLSSVEEVFLIIS